MHNARNASLALSYNIIIIIVINIIICMYNWRMQTWCV